MKKTRYTYSRIKIINNKLRKGNGNNGNKQIY